MFLNFSNHSLNITMPLFTISKLKTVFTTITMKLSLSLLRTSERSMMSWMKKKRINSINLNTITSKFKIISTQFWKSLNPLTTIYLIVLAHYLEKNISNYSLLSMKPTWKKLSQDWALYFKIWLRERTINGKNIWVLPKDQKNLNKYKKTLKTKSIKEETNMLKLVNKNWIWKN